MRIVLLQNVKGLGRRLEVKDVPDGYARNFLIAKKLATAATPEAIAKKNDAEQSTQATLAGLAATAKKLASETLYFFVKTGERGAVFGSVSREDVAKALSERGYRDAKVILPKAIKTLGKEMVPVDLGHGIVASVNILIAGAE